MQQDQVLKLQAQKNTMDHLGLMEEHLEQLDLSGNKLPQSPALPPKPVSSPHPVYISDNALTNASQTLMT